MQEHHIKHPNLLDITYNHRQYHGFNQLWYTKGFQRNAGCGPTAASMLFHYVLEQRQEAAVSGHKSSDILALMEAVWQFVTPGFMGLHRTDKFKQGVEALLKSYQIKGNCEVMTVRRRQNFHGIKAFLEQAFDRDAPVAFLNLQRGEIRAVDGWHWIVLTGITDDNQVTALDGGLRKTFDLKKWVETTRLGGGFCYIELL